MIHKGLASIAAVPSIKDMDNHYEHNLLVEPSALQLVENRLWYRKDASGVSQIEFQVLTDHNPTIEGEKSQPASVIITRSGVSFIDTQNVEVHNNGIGDARKYNTRFLSFSVLHREKDPGNTLLRVSKSYEYGEGSPCVVWITKGNDIVRSPNMFSEYVESLNFLRDYLVALVQSNISSDVADLIQARLDEINNEILVSTRFYESTTPGKSLT